MPSEVGVGYQGPPEVRDGYGPEVERKRSLEDYVSRRIFAYLARTSDQYVSPGVLTAISWHTAASTDSSGLFATDGTNIIIPEGARGDYLLSLQITWRDKLGAAAAGMSIFKNGVVYAQTEGAQPSISIFTDMSVVEGDIITAHVYTKQYVNDPGSSLSWSGLPADADYPLARPPTSLRIRRLL